jgi:hypothetical protein
MSTRQLRLTTPDQIRNKISGFTGKKINIVMFNNTVLLGKLQRSNDTVIEITNMRLHKMILPIKDISEIYFDTKE